MDTGHTPHCGVDLSWVLCLLLLLHGTNVPTCNIQSLFSFHFNVDKSKIEVLPWKTVWHFLNEINIELPLDPAIPLIGL